MGSPQWNRTAKLVIIVSLIVLLLLALYLLRDLLLPVIMAVVLATILKPLVDLLNKRAGLPRTLAALVVYGLLLVGLVIVVAAVVPFASPGHAPQPGRPTAGQRPDHLPVPTDHHLSLHL